MGEKEKKKRKRSARMAAATIVRYLDGACARSPCIFIYTFKSMGIFIQNDYGNLWE